ncbi:MAG: radical SAM family heme chaperone HemW [Planctomycetaceae bacterium]|nr:radical SAM family heme chaperone HemW [Planctomycetaceae bacterium]
MLVAVTTNSRFVPPRAAYIHVPFCRHRCGYCNFTLIAGRDDLAETYLRAIAQELSLLKTPREVDTLFIGGGTPTHLSLAQLQQLCETVTRWFPLAAGHEFSVEANPLDVTEAKSQLLASYGVNRMSIGVQSFADKKLALLERDHRGEQIDAAFGTARRTMRSVSIDLIFGAPGETLGSWLNDLEQAVRLGPDHVSTYGLTFERGTSFWVRLQRDEIRQVEEEDERRMYLAGIETLTEAGFEHYEVSNFAKPDHRCRHNEVYWSGSTYYAAGPGAARFVDGCRETNHRSTTTYLNRVLADRSPVAESEVLSPEDSARERLVFGLRRMEGVERASFESNTGFIIEQLVGQSLDKAVSRGVLEDTGTQIRLTREGLLVSDSIWPEFLDR